MLSDPNAPAQSNAIAIRKYRAHAAGYDRSAAFTMPLRQRAVALLQLRPGETVLDVGAGTGLSYGLLRDGVGINGWVLGVEQSPDMFAEAEARVARAGWDNVWHEQGFAETVRLPRPADAALFNYTHDICRTPSAVDNIMRQLRPGARVAMAGMKFFPWWTGPLNLFVWAKNLPYNARPADLWKPWDIVMPYCATFRVWTKQAGMGYLASGTVGETLQNPPSFAAC